jgi:hypothetical protein
MDHVSNLVFFKVWEIRSYLVRLVSKLLLFDPFHESFLMLLGLSL